jgi:hypothetical protein
VRVPAVISVGGTSLRVHLSNAMGTAPVTLTHVTVAAQSSGAVPSGTPLDVTFGSNSSTSVTIPAGGDVASNAVPLATSQQETLLVSVYTAGTVTAVGHAEGRATAWTSTSATDEASDTTGTTFTQTMDNVYWLTGIDVTSLGNTNGSVAFWGDQTINSDTSSGAPNRFTDDVTAGLATANGGTVPYGIVNLGTATSGTGNTVFPVLDANIEPGSTADPLDRDILAQANLRTVILSAGTQDILNGASAVTVQNDIKTLVYQITSYYSDTGTNNNLGKITVYVATIPPSAQFTAAEESVREAVNAAICGSAPTTGACNPGGANATYIGGANGYVDFAAAVSAGGTDLSDTVASGDLNSNGSPDNAYYKAEASAFVTSATATAGSLGTQPDHTRSVTR